MKETPKHRKAFEFYAGMTEDRSLAAVGRKFGVTKQAAEKWSRAFRWQEKLVERDKRIKERISAESEESELEARKRILALIKWTHKRYLERLKSDRINPNTNDFVSTSMLEMKLREVDGGADPADAFDGMEVEQVERIIVERFKRITNTRSLPDPSDF